MRGMKECVPGHTPSLSGEKTFILRVLFCRESVFSIQDSEWISRNEVAIFREVQCAVDETKEMEQPYAESKVKTYLCKMKGGKCTTASGVSTHGLLITSLGSFIGIGLVALLSSYYQLPLLLPSFGATAVLLYAACHVPMAQPRNVVGGHIISALAGVTVYQLFGGLWWTLALGVTLAIISMAVTNTLHPPGGATAFVAVYTGQDFGFVLSPVGLGAVCLILVALLVNNLSHRCRYPQYWF